MSDFNPNPPTQPLVAPQPSQVVQQVLPTSGKAIASFICGAFSFLLATLCAGIVLGPTAIILGIMALNDITRAKQTIKGRGLAIAGICLGTFFLLVALVTIFMHILVAYLEKS